MLYGVNFAKKLSLLMEHYDLSASALADKLDINRSSISHIISGRNKPSLDFVMNLVETFKNDVSLEWLLYDKGKFPKETIVNKPIKTTVDTIVNSSSSCLKEPVVTSINKNINSDNKEIDHIIIFYKDGSFKSYQNN